MDHEYTNKYMLPEMHECTTAGSTFTPMCAELKGKVVQRNPSVSPEKSASTRKTNKMSKARYASYILLTVQLVSIRVVV